ncbi:CHAT domain-containing protein [Kitasatospora sp. NPDC058190]|uniref:CHAT domain-containing protein n=1 Tax=Kitasatospora sp. NPDC058190 TaxID=3346371 RepID=UPI0036D7A7A1
MAVGHYGGAMRDALVEDLDARLAEYAYRSETEALLDEAGRESAMRLMALVAEEVQGSRNVDTEALYTAAAFHWARAVVLGDGDRAQVEHETAIHLFGLLFLADHRKVPRELWPRLVQETGHDPWADPLEHAADLVVDFEEQQDWAALDEALGLLQRIPRGGDGAYQDTLLGLAHQYRATALARDDRSRLADADRAVELLSAVAALPEPSASRAATRLLTLGSAHVGRFELTGLPADLADAARSYRRALELAAPGSTEQVSAMIGVGAGFGRQAEATGIEQSDVVAQLREAVDWLRRAADLDLEHGRQPNRANLAKATGLLLENSLRLRRAGAAATDRGMQDAPTPPPPPTEAEAAQARRLIVLSDEVAQRVITEQEALRRVGDSGCELSEAAVQAVVAVAISLVRSGAPRRAVAVLALALAAAELRWGAGRHGPWWLAADSYVEAARLTLAEQPDAALFQHAREVVGRQIDELRGRDAAQDVAELAETLFADGLLCLTPYTGELADLSFAAAQQLRRDREARHTGIHTARWEGATMPDPQCAIEEAVARLREAAVLSTGHQRGRTLKALAEALTMLAGLTGTSHDREITVAVREAVKVLDPLRDPPGYLYLLKILSLLGELVLPRELDGLLPVPLCEVRDRQGEHEAASLFTEALLLAAEAGRRDLEAALLDAADGAGLRLRQPAQHRVRWTSEVHLLHEDSLGCPVLGGTRAVAEELAADGARQPTERAAGLVHLAAHSGEDDEQALGRTLILEAARTAPAWVDQHVEMVAYLYGRLSYDLAVRADHVADWATAAEYFAVAGAQYAICRQDDLALDAFEAGLTCVRRCDHPVASGAANALLGSMTSLRASADEGIAWKLRELYLSLGHFLSAHASVDVTTVLLLHQAAKGMDFAIAAERSGPFTPSRALADAIGRASLDASQPVPAEQALSPDDAILCYVGTGEAEPESGTDARQRNLQRAVDRRISVELHLTRNLSRNTLLGLDEVQMLLPEDTVLLSLYLGQLPGPNATDLRTGTVGLAMTREEVRLRTVALNDIGGDLLRLTRGLHTLLIHPMAGPVSLLRQAVTADPLHRLVSREAGAALEAARAYCLADFTELMGRWHAQGKRHLCIWPNGPLHFVPFSLLPVADGLVADDWTVTQLSSLASLRTTTAELTPPTAGRELVAFGSATGGVQHGLVAETALERHASSVATSMGGRAVLGAAATPRRFLRELGTARYVHVAAHGAHNEWASWYQCLFLSPDPDNDGRVFAHDILRTDLRGVELVTMSSCESALGRYDVNDNLRGLPAAFLAAGASAVIGCLWPVHPDVATDFFAELYRQLCGNGDRRSAFRSAQCHTRTKHPAYRDWGSFCFIGDWRAPHTPRGVAQ